MSLLEKTKDIFSNPANKKRATESLDLWLPIALFGVVIFSFFPSIPSCWTRLLPWYR